MNALATCRTAVEIAAALALFSCMAVEAQDSAFKLPRETQRDMGSGFEKRYETAMRAFADPNANLKVFKFDIDADINHDGVINEADAGWLEDTPPGCVLKVGSSTSVRVTLGSHYPYFPGTAVARLEVCGINRDNPTGEFASLADEVSSSGHIIVWTDAAHTKKLLDSSDPKMRVVEWIVKPGYILPEHTGIPGFVYVEAAGASGKYSGDVRLMATVAPMPAGSSGEKTYKFRVAEDHILFTFIK